MTKHLLSPAALVAVLAAAAAAHAQSTPAPQASCPPGSWFCAQAPQQQAAPAGEPVQSLEPLPDPEAPPPPPPHIRVVKPRRSPPGPPPPPPVYYQPPPPPDLWRPEMPPPFAPPAHRELLSPPREWGLNAHLEGAMIGRGTAGDASMGGGGVALRYKPTRAFGLEAGLDFVGGTDYQGYSRNERAFTLNALVFLNPRSRAQIYLLGGFGWAGATVENDAQSQNSSYSYFGGQAGVGLEIRLSRSFALDGDLRGFVRSRTDSLAQSQPEFTDQYGRTTNTSAGGLLTAGMTLYF
jgi:Outer membrane protein beta-barrel domain